MGIVGIVAVVLILSCVLATAIHLATSSSYLCGVIRELLALPFRALIGLLKGK